VVRLFFFLHPSKPLIIFALVADFSKDIKLPQTFHSFLPFPDMITPHFDTPSTEADISFVIFSFRFSHFITSLSFDVYFIVGLTISGIRMHD